MNRKRLASILLSMAIGGLVLSKLGQIYVLFGASPTPDPASGRTEPVLFAPAISRSWDYTTSGEIWLLAALTATFLVCFVAWAIMA